MARFGRGYPIQPKIVNRPGPEAHSDPATTQGLAQIQAAGTRTTATPATTQGLAQIRASGTKTVTGTVAIPASGAVTGNGNPGGAGTTSGLARIQASGSKTAPGAATVNAAMSATVTGADIANGTLRIPAASLIQASGAKQVTGRATVTAAAVASVTGAKQATSQAAHSGRLTQTLTTSGLQVIATYQAAWSAPATPTAVPPPAGVSVPVTVANGTGNWLFAVVAWRQAPGYPPVTVHTGDGVNWWEPMGAPGGTSPDTGDVRIAVWRAAAARPVSVVSVAPTGFALSVTVTIYEVAGIGPWVAETPTVTAYAAAAATLPALSPAPPGVLSFYLTAAARDQASVTTTVPAGWAQGPMAATGNGLDHTADLVLLTAFQQSAQAVSAQWSGDTACGMAGIAAGVEEFAAQPDQPNPAWPGPVLELAVGAGAQTPADELTWTPVDGTLVNGQALTRVQDFTFAQGQQYVMSALQSGQGAVTLDNRDLAFTPPGIGPFAGVDSGTPWRLRMVWPGGGGAPVNPTPHYVLTGFLNWLPSTWKQDTRRGVIQATLTDSWAYCQAQVQSSMRQEILGDGPTHYWPAGDPSGATYGSNLAPASIAALVMVTSKYGNAGAAAGFGDSGGAPAGFANASGPLPGDGGTVWAQTGLPAAATSGGYALYCQDSAFPEIVATNGITIAGWFSITATQMYQPMTLWAVKGTKGPIARVQAAPGGALTLQTWDVAGNTVTTALGTGTYLGTGMFQVAWAYVRGIGWVAYVNGAQVAASVATPALPPTFAWIEAGGEADRYTSGNMLEGQVAHLAVFPQALPAARVASQYWAGSVALQGEPDWSRIERLLAYGGYTGRRVLTRTTPADLCASASNLGTTQASSGGAGFGSPAGVGTVQAGQVVADTAASLSPAMLTVAATGDVVYLGKGTMFGQQPTWALGENTAGGEIPYLGDIGFGWDPQKVINLIQITQLDRQDIVTPQVRVTETASQKRYAQSTYQVTGYLNNDLTTPISSATPSNLLDLANWIAETLQAPQLRADQVTVDAASYPPAWPLVLGARPGDIATVTIRPVTAPAAISVTARIMRIERSITWRSGGTKGQARLSLDYAPETAVLTLDDPVYGLIGAYTMPW